MTKIEAIKFEIRNLETLLAAERTLGARGSTLRRKLADKRRQLHHLQAGE